MVSLLYIETLTLRHLSLVHTPTMSPDAIRMANGLTRAEVSRLWNFSFNLTALAGSADAVMYYMQDHPELRSSDFVPHLHQLESAREFLSIAGTVLYGRDNAIISSPMPVDFPVTPSPVPIDLSDPSDRWVWPSRTVAGARTCEHIPKICSPCIQDT